MNTSRITIKKLISILFILVLSGCMEGRRPASVDPSKDFKSLFITGASISANWNGVSSPGLKMAQAYKSDVMIKAHGGKKSSYVLQNLDNYLKLDMTLIIGVDLFFWDSVSNNCDLGKKQIDSFLQKISEKKVKVILGNIPPLVNRMYCRSQLNDHLEKVCHESSNCYLYDFDSLIHELQRKDLAKYFQSDKIHLTNEGSRFAAEAILEDLGIVNHPQIN